VEKRAACGLAHSTFGRSSRTGAACKGDGGMRVAAPCFSTLVLKFPCHRSDRYVVDDGWQFLKGTSGSSGWMPVPPYGFQPAT
jgi:hypothetical protein